MRKIKEVLRLMNLTWTIRTVSYLHLPAIALAQARRAGPTIIFMWMSTIQKGLLSNLLKMEVGFRWIAVA